MASISCGLLDSRQHSCQAADINPARGPDGMQSERKHMINLTSFPDRPRAIAMAALMLLAHNPAGALAGFGQFLLQCGDAAFGFLQLT
jgi:hypothetical protein